MVIRGHDVTLEAAGGSIGNAQALNMEVTGDLTARARLLNLVQHGDLAVERLTGVDSLSLQVLGARLGTLQASVGRLAVGGVADLCVFDPAALVRVDPAALRSQGKHTPFEGHELPAQIRATLVGGQVAHAAAGA